VTNAADLLNRARTAAAEVVIAISGSMLTDDMIDLLCDVSAGKSRSELRAMYSVKQPAEKDRTGIIIPWLTAGPLREVPQRLHDVAVLLSSVMMSTASDSSGIAHQLQNTIEWAFKVRPGQQQPGQTLIKAVGSRGMTLAELQPPGPSGVWMRNVAEPFTTSALWAMIGLTPRQLGIGFSGSEELKGMIPGGVVGLAGGSTRVTRDVPTAGFGGSLADVEGDASTLLETGKMP